MLGALTIVDEECDPAKVFPPWKVPALGWGGSGRGSRAPCPPALQRGAAVAIFARMSSLTGRQKRYLRSLAQPLEPVIWVGAGGVAPGVVRSLGEALDTHELIKVRMREPEDKRALAHALAEAAGAELAGLVGHTVILYRRHPEKPKIDPSGSRLRGSDDVSSGRS